MDSGPLISGIGHGALLAWALIGGMFSRAPDDTFEVSEVSIISAEEFAALSAPQPTPEATQNVPTPPVPEIEDTPPEQPVVAAPPEVPDTPINETPPRADVAPDVAPDVVEAPPPIAEVDDTPPEVVQPPVQDNPVVLAPPSTTASPRPAPRVAPTPVEAPPPDTEVAEETREQTTDSSDAQTQSEPEEATAPEEANDRIVTEADEPPSSAPTSSSRPSARPKRPTPPVEAATNDNSTRDAIADALAGVQTEDATAPASAPVGPPLTGGDKDVLRVAVSSCWNVGSLSTDALQTTVVVSMTMGKDGKPDNGSIRMLSSSGGSSAAAKQAFEAARRAIIRCTKGGYKLPIEKYSHWREIEMTFNPEKMRIK
ncbi:MAG: energy transducer TonB [Marinosulfonomonas sp.]|nr:MAG: energy transducer TonB [Marinosulfonomonas sp.]